VGKGTPVLIASGKKGEKERNKIGGWLGPQGKSGRFGKEENLLPLPGPEPRIF